VPSITAISPNITPGEKVPSRRLRGAASGSFTLTVIAPRASR
jgi:hypothetical protein